MVGFEPTDVRFESHFWNQYFNKRITFIDIAGRTKWLSRRSHKPQERVQLPYPQPLGVGRVWVIASVLKTEECKKLRGFKSHTPSQLVVGRVWIIATVSKTVERKFRGFESHTTSQWKVAEWTIALGC